MKVFVCCASVICCTIAMGAVLADTRIAEPPAASTVAPAPALNTPEACAVCHGPEGNSVMGAYPVLAGQTARYLYLQLRDFKEGRRQDQSMSPIAQALGKEEMQQLAQHFSEQKPKPLAFNADDAKVAAGRKKAEESLCSMCHLGGLAGQNEIPRLAGQQPEYVIKQLKAFRSKTRTNDAGNMAAYTANLSDEDIDNLAQYITTLQ